MQTEGVYRQNDLTIERLAERLDTNRTYISRAINQQAGKTFSSYVNSYRIDEAVRRLSDVDDDTPLKALAQTLGYNHLQTFYTSFPFFGVCFFSEFVNFYEFRKRAFHKSSGFFYFCQ